MGSTELIRKELIKGDSLEVSDDDPMHNPQGLLFSKQIFILRLFCTVETVQMKCTVQTVNIIEQTVHCKVFTVNWISNCTLQTVHCTVNCTFYPPKG